jgi:tryptophan halogenase
MTVPDSLAELLELWRTRGHLAIDGGHLFQLGSWSSILIGQNFEPEAVHALADRATPAYAAREVRRIAHEVREAARTLPPHDAFLASYCPAEPIEMRV